MKRSQKFYLQFGLAVSLLIFIGILIYNLWVNLSRTDMLLSFRWLEHPAGFPLAEHPLSYKPSDSYIWALCMGWLNSLKVIICGLLAATVLGGLAGTARSSRNALLRALSSGYVALIRQIPLLLQLFFWYFAGFLRLSQTPLAPLGTLIQVSKQGVELLGLHLSSEFSALLVGLSVFTGASIAEVVRGGINSVPRGQWEAFRSLGLPEGLGLRSVVLPQALPAILPGLTSQYLNLAKNSTLAIAVAYADLYKVINTTITQTNRAIEGFLLLLISFLMLNLLITGGMELLNRLVLKSQQSS